MVIVETTGVVAHHGGELLELEHVTFDELLPIALARASCPGAFSVLEGNFRQLRSECGVRAFALLADQRSNPLLMEELRRSAAKGGRGGDFRDALAEAVAALHITDAVPLLMSLPESPAAAVALGRLGDIGAREHLQQLVKDNGGAGKEVVFSARMALAALEREKRPSKFEELLKGSFDDRGVTRVVEMMDSLDDPGLVPLFMTLVATRDEKFVVRDAVSHLGRMKAREAVPVLLASFDRQCDPVDDNGIFSYPSSAHRANLVRALEMISGEDLGPDKEPWERWWKGQAEPASTIQLDER